MSMKSLVYWCKHPLKWNGENMKLKSSSSDNISQNMYWSVNNSIIWISAMKFSTHFCVDEVTGQILQWFQCQGACLNSHNVTQTSELKQKTNFWTGHSVCVCPSSIFLFSCYLLSVSSNPRMQESVKKQRKP